MTPCDLCSVPLPTLLCTWAQLHQGQIIFAGCTAHLQFGMQAAPLPDLCRSLAEDPKCGDHSHRLTYEVTDEPKPCWEGMNMRISK